MDSNPIGTTLMAVVAISCGALPTVVLLLLMKMGTKRKTPPMRLPRTTTIYTDIPVIDIDLGD